VAGDLEPSAEEVVILLATPPERLADMTSWLAEAQLDYRHGPAFPTVRELIGHLAGAASIADGAIRRAAVDGLDTVDFGAATDASVSADLTLPADELLQSYLRVRRRTVDLLRGLSAETWNRIVQDPRMGRLTVLEACRGVAGHEVGHLSQVRNLVALVPERRDLGPISLPPG
jgi:hypothetical protein